MPDSVLSNWAGNTALALLLGGPCWLGLFQADPTAAANLASEVAGGGYEREPITFTSPSGKTAVSTLATIHALLPGILVTHLGVLDASGAGHLIFTIDLTDQPGGGITVPPSGQFITAAGDIAVNL